MWKLRLQSGESPWERDKWRGGGWALVFTEQDSHNYCDNGQSLKHPYINTLLSVENTSKIPQLSLSTGNDIGVYIPLTVYVKTDRASGYKIDINLEVPKTWILVFDQQARNSYITTIKVLAANIETSTKFKSLQSGCKQTFFYLL